MRERLTWQPVYIVGGVLVTTATAGLAVEPFSAYHFHNLTSYAALGNLLGGPPVDLARHAGHDRGADRHAFRPGRMAAEGDGPRRRRHDGRCEIGRLDARLADRRAGLSLCRAARHRCGGLWLIIWRRPWRLAGLAVIGLGVAMTSIHEKPDIYVDRDAKVVAIRDKDGKLQAPKSRSAYYTLAQWLKADGDDRKPKEASLWARLAMRCL